MSLPSSVERCLDTRSMRCPWLIKTWQKALWYCFSPALINQFSIALSSIPFLALATDDFVKAAAKCRVAEPADDTPLDFQVGRFPARHLRGAVRLKREFRAIDQRKVAVNGQFFERDLGEARMAARDRFFSDFVKTPNHESGVGLRESRHLLGKDLRAALDDLSLADRLRNPELPKPRGFSHTLT